MEIKSVTGRVLFSDDSPTVLSTVENAVKVGANLDGANLDGANLDGAYLSPIYTIKTFCQFVNLAEWGPLLAFISDKGLVWIKVGCQSFSLEDAHRHWADRKDRAKTKLILKLVEEWSKLV